MTLPDRSEWTIHVCPICRALVEVLHADDIGMDTGCPEHGVVEGIPVIVVEKP